MGSFRVCLRIEPSKLKKIASESIGDIVKWFKKNPKRRVCHVELWHGIRRVVTRKNVDIVINRVLEETLKKDAEDKERFEKVGR